MLLVMLVCVPPCVRRHFDLGQEPFAANYAPFASRTLLCAF
jgi:hypothetical protein